MDNNDWLDIAENYAKRSTCIRRKYGSVIVRDNSQISCGVNDAPHYRKTCKELGYCVRSKYNIPRGTRYELCRSIHSELDAIIHAGESKTIGTSLYLVGLENDGSYVENAEPCIMCKKAIINAGIKIVYVRIDHNNYKRFYVDDWIKNDETINCEDSYIQSSTN